MPTASRQRKPGKLPRLSEEKAFTWHKVHRESKLKFIGLLPDMCRDIPIRPMVFCCILGISGGVEIFRVLQNDQKIKITIDNGHYI
jgi:hypothetical protein